jgi:hypothetical protein
VTVIAAEPEREYVTEIWSPAVDDGRHHLHSPMPEPEPVPELEAEI